MMKEKNSKLLAIILSVLTITVVVISVFLIKKDNDADMNLLTVNNASEFFTVNSCLYRITNYVYKKDMPRKPAGNQLPHSSDSDMSGFA